MAQSLTSKIDFSLGWTVTDSSRGPAPLTDSNKLAKSYSFTAGDGVSQVNIKWFSSRTLAGSVSETLDLTALLESVFANSLTYGFTKIRGIAIENQSTSHDIRVGAAATNVFLGPLLGTAPTIDVAAASAWQQTSAAGWVVDSTHKNLKIANQGAGSVTYRIGIVGSDDSEVEESSSSSEE